MDDDSLDQDDWVERGMADALAELLREWDGPLIPVETLLDGAISGFDEAVAESVLIDRTSIAWLNAWWNAHEDAVGQEFPSRLTTLLAEERHYGGAQWNLRVAHAAGHGWSDDDADDALFALTTQELSSAPFSDDVRVLARSRGTAQAASEEAEPWETCFRSQHFLVLVRQEAGTLTVEMSSDSKSGLFEVTLRWPHGPSSAHLVKIRVGEPGRLQIEPAIPGFPAAVSIRVAPGDR